MMCNVINAFTVDVEDYYHVSAFADRIRTSEWEHYESRVVANTHRILRLMDRYAVHGTFFILGWVADRYPSLIRDISKNGHELGSHGYWHRPIHEQTKADFRDDLVRARDAINQAAGITVTAYRAPSFSIIENTLWALDVLAEEGFAYDSSIFPIRHDRYGMPNAARFAHQVTRSAGMLTEFPPSVYRFAGFNLPVSGGGYFRMLPLSMTLHAVRKLNSVDHQPFLFYIHPWEIDPDQPRLSGSIRSRFRHYLNLGSTEQKLNGLLRSMQFSSMTDALKSRMTAQPVTTATISP